MPCSTYGKIHTCVLLKRKSWKTDQMSPCAVQRKAVFVWYSGRCYNPFQTFCKWKDQCFHNTSNLAGWITEPHEEKHLSIFKRYHRIRYGLSWAKAILLRHSQLQRWVQGARTVSVDDAYCQHEQERQNRFISFGAESRKISKLPE